MKTGIQHFHAHLDVCKQCANNPFDLCPEGVKRLKEAAAINNPALTIMAKVNNEIQNYLPK